MRTVRLLNSWSHIFAGASEREAGAVVTTVERRGGRESLTDTLLLSMLTLPWVSTSTIQHLQSFLISVNDSDLVTIFSFVLSH